MDIEFIGYVIKLGNYYLNGRIQNSISIVKKPQQAEIYDEDELDIAERVASDLGGTIRKIYVSDKEWWRWTKILKKCQKSLSLNFGMILKIGRS